MIRAWAAFPPNMHEPKFNWASFSTIVEDCSFYNAVWLFSAMIYESAYDIERILVKQSEEDDTDVMKRKFTIGRIVAAIITLVAYIPLACALCTIDISLYTRKILAATTLCVLALVIACTMVFMVLAVWKLRKVGKLNPWLSTIYFTGVCFWSASWYSILALEFIFSHNLNDYRHLVAILISCQVATNSSVAIFATIALILYRSAIAARFCESMRDEDTDNAEPWDVHIDDISYDTRSEILARNIPLEDLHLCEGLLSVFMKPGEEVEKVQWCR